MNIVYVSRDKLTYRADLKVYTPAETSVTDINSGNFPLVEGYDTYIFSGEKLICRRVPNP